MTALARLKNWDYLLTVATVALLGSLGVQSFIGTAYVWWATYSVPGFTAVGYRDYNQVMNAIAAPQVVALVILMGLCVPKRLLDRTTLVAVSAIMLLAGAVAWVATGSLATGLAVYLALAGLIQAAVVALAIAGVRGPSHLTEGRLIRIGSGLLHFGFIAFAFVLVALQQSAFMLPAFWAATALTLVGTVLTFYASTFAWRRRVRVDVDKPLAEG